MRATYFGGWILTILSIFVAEAFSISPANIQKSLKPQLSEGAEIYHPGQVQYDKAVERWSYYHAPNFTLVVEVATEDDVIKTVRYANNHNIPFLAINGGHGTIASLSGMSHGIEIWLHKLNSSRIADDGKTATFGGGILSKDLVDALWAKGKQTVNGVCECTGYLGPALGGGHGILQGKYGLMSDQFVALRVVTADGNLREVSMDSPERDLFWGMQGAGHNFGIVTSFTSKIYDVPKDNLWAHERHAYTQDKLEQVFKLLNHLADIQPEGFLIWADISRDEELDAKYPIININYVREGVHKIEDKYLAGFRSLNPVKLERHSGPYVEIPKWIETDMNARGCEKGGIIKVRFPITFHRYNIAAQRKLFDAYANGTAGNSSFAHSAILLEGYSVNGVKNFPAEYSAFPHRSDDLLISPVINYFPGGGPELDARARKFGDRLRNIILEGGKMDELHAYVNYASGDESPESWYGYESWRMDRLKQLKMKYDPEEKFSYYGPIPLDEKGVSGGQ